MAEPNLLATFQSKLKQASTQASASYMLVKVDRLSIGSKDPNNFQITGRRLDNDAPVVVTSRKSNSNQALPLIGSIMRADKTSRVTSRANPAVPQYSAEYFHTYGPGSLCLQGMMRANRPYTRDNQTFASVDVIDVEMMTARITSMDEFDRVILATLKPWAFKGGPLNEDAAGNKIWTKDGCLGIQPTVQLRLMGAANNAVIDKGMLFGLGAVDRVNGQALPAPRLPRDDEILAHVRKSAMYEMLRNLTQEEGFSGVGYIPIPGIRINVGRDALNEGNEKYLGAPRSWNWVRRDLPQENGNHPVNRGWRGGILHVKDTGNGRKIAVDAAPSAQWPLSLHPGLTTLEARLAKPAGAQREQKAPESGTAQAGTQQPVKQQQRAGTAVAPQDPLEDSYDSPTPRNTGGGRANPQQQNDFGTHQPRTENIYPSDDDYSQPANRPDGPHEFADYSDQDLAMMESMAGGGDGQDGAAAFQDDYLDDLFEAAQSNATQRTSFPRM